MPLYVEVTTPMQDSGAAIPWVCLAISSCVSFYYRLDLEKNQVVLSKTGGENPPVFL